LSVSMAFDYFACTVYSSPCTCGLGHHSLVSPFGHGNCLIRLDRLCRCILLGRRCSCSAVEFSCISRTVAARDPTTEHVSFIVKTIVLIRKLLPSPSLYCHPDPQESSSSFHLSEDLLLRMLSQLSAHSVTGMIRMPVRHIERVRDGCCLSSFPALISCTVLYISTTLSC
jgi:hypothetical protein